MGSHHHRAERIDTATVPRRVLLAFLPVVGVAALVGLVVLWPRRRRPPEAPKWSAEGGRMQDA